MTETNRPLWVVRSNSDVFVITFGEKENGEINKDLDTFLCGVSSGGPAERSQRISR